MLYRIATCKFIRHLDGVGSSLYGGRWNGQGNPMVYTAGSRALAVLEVLVHLQPKLIPDDFCLVEIEAPDNSILSLNVASLPDGWNNVSPPLALKQIGNKFLRDKDYLLMKVPSSVVDQEFNYLINPTHALMESVAIKSVVPFRFDDRLLHLHQPAKPQ